jgi:magnesium transporter
METDVASVAPGTDQEEAARLLQHYRLRALPVVDADGVLLGVITADDIIDVIQEEATEDMYKMAGVGVKEWVFSPLRESIVRRVPWLSFNMAWAFAGAGVISLFQGTLEKAAEVAIFMPMIAGQAGNAGIQTATIVVRSMALGEVHLRDIFRVLGKEIALGATKGLIFGTALGLIAWLWQGDVYLGAIAGTALFLNMLIAGTAGVLIPMTLRRLGLDPATIAGVFDTMLTDLMGFLIYLGLATIFISKLQ